MKIYIMGMKGPFRRLLNFLSHYNFSFLILSNKTYRQESDIFTSDRKKRDSNPQI